jgi:hypothetical protein
MRRCGSNMPIHVRAAPVAVQWFLALLFGCSPHHRVSAPIPGAAPDCEGVTWQAIHTSKPVYNAWLSAVHGHKAVFQALGHDPRANVEYDVHTGRWSGLSPLESSEPVQTLVSPPPNDWHDMRGHQANILLGPNEPQPISIDLTYSTASHIWKSQFMPQTPLVIGTSEGLLLFDTDREAGRSNVVQFCLGHRYDFKTRHLTPMNAKNCPTDRESAAIAGFDHKVFIWGGHGADTSSLPLSDGAIYDWKRDTWAPVAKHREATCGYPVATVFGDRILVYGSDSCEQPPPDADPDFVANGSIYDGRRNQWTRVSPVGAPKQRDIAGKYSINHFVRAGAYLVSRRVPFWVFEPITNHWTHIDLPHESGLIHVLGLNDGRLLGVEMNYSHHFKAFVVQPNSGQYCRLPLDQVPFLQPHKGTVGLRNAVIADGHLLIWGKTTLYLTHAASSCRFDCAIEGIPRSDDHQQGVVVTLPSQ